MESPPNPLTQFLAGWMTPQDYALLKPGLQPSDTAKMLPQTESMAAPATSMSVSIILGTELANSTSTSERSMVGAATQLENPYLQMLSDPAPLAVFTPPVQPIASTAGPSPAPMIFVPAPAPAPPAKIPEFAKPPDDNKYFKPLKRF